MSITYNSPVTDNRPTGPSNFYNNIEEPAHAHCITDAALELNSQARAVCLAMSINAAECGCESPFSIDSESVTNALDAISTLLEQQNAILKHPQVK